MKENTESVVATSKVTEKKIPEKEFTIQKLPCGEPVQIVEFLVSLKSVSPEHISMIALKIADKVNSDHALIFNVDYNLPDWGIGILLMNIETVSKPWVGVYAIHFVV